MAMNFTIGPAFALFLVFMVLKLTHHITWSWVWVTAPLWVGLATFFGILLIMVLFGLIAGAVGDRWL